MKQHTLKVYVGLPGMVIIHDGRPLSEGEPITMPEPQGESLKLSKIVRDATDVEIAEMEQITATPTTPPLNANPDTGGTSQTENDEKTIALIAVIAALDKDNSELWTNSGKPQAKALEAADSIDFEVSAAMRDQAWEAYQAASEQC